MRTSVRLHKWARFTQLYVIDRVCRDRPTYEIEDDDIRASWRHDMELYFTFYTHICNYTITIVIGNRNETERNHLHNYLYVCMYIIYIYSYVNAKFPETKKLYERGNSHAAIVVIDIHFG